MSNWPSAPRPSAFLAGDKGVFPHHLRAAATSAIVKSIKVNGADAFVQDFTVTNASVFATSVIWWLLKSNAMLLLSTGTTWIYVMYDISCMFQRLISGGYGSELIRVAEQTHLGRQVTGRKPFEQGYLEC